MTNERWQKTEEIFGDALLLSPDERQAYVSERCGGDFAMHSEICEMLAEDGADNNPLNHPIFHYGVELLANDFGNFFPSGEFAGYKLRRILGRGGMGVVILAEDARLERLIALKILTGSITLDDETAIRFQQEARAISAISHPNVAYVHEAGISDGHHFIAMEYVPGKTLRQHLTEGKLDNRFVIEVSLQISKSLAACHAAGIIHRDIKPENVMISKDNHVKVLDFGLAKFTDPLNIKAEEFKNFSTSGRVSIDTKPGMIMGTTPYMSPEQVRGKPLTVCTDIWSFGAVLYEMLAGKRPFTGETSSDVRAAILLSKPLPLSSMRVMPKLARLAHRCLEKNRDERCVTADEIVAELRMAWRKMDLSPPGIQSPKPADFRYK